MISEIIEKVINENIQNVVHIIPIGNHALKRHYVFLVETNRKKYVMKFYYVAKRWNREVSALLLLKDYSFLSPKLIKYGVNDDVEWILYDYENGSLLDDVELEITYKNLKRIYKAAGEQLSRIHSHRQFGEFGSLNENLEYVKAYKTFNEYFLTEIERVFNNLDKFDHEEYELIKDCKKTLLEKFELLEPIREGHLCHNDFGSRNIIVDVENSEYKIKSIIDFEQSVISDRYRELTLVKMKFLKDNQLLSEAFYEGYRKNLNIDENVLDQREKIYLLQYGLSICGWSKEVDKNHYNEGIDLLRGLLRNIKESSNT